MGWLKKVGIILAKTAEFIAFGGPLISALIPGTKDDQIIGISQSVIGKAIAVIVQVEAFGAALGLAGAEKLKAAIGPMSEIFLEFFKGRKVKDVARWRGGIAQIVSGLAECLSSLDDADIETRNPA
jgi:uncharacterized protein (DUF4213/DUF364 family)